MLRYSGSRVESTTSLRCFAPQRKGGRAVAEVASGRKHDAASGACSQSVWIKKSVLVSKWRVKGSTEFLKRKRKRSVFPLFLYFLQGKDVQLNTGVFFFSAGEKSGRKSCLCKRLLKTEFLACISIKLRYKWEQRNIFKNYLFTKSLINHSVIFPSAWYMLSVTKAFLLTKKLSEKNKSSIYITEMYFKRLIGSNLALEKTAFTNSGFAQRVDLVWSI